MNWENLNHCLELRDLGAGRFEGENYALDYYRVFGGQILAQTVAALAAGADGMAVKFLTHLFSREGSAEAPMDYRVEERQRGRTFGSFSVSAQQGERLVGVSQASLHHPETGYERSDPPPDAGDPEDARTVATDMVPWEIRVVGTADIGSPAAQPPHYSFWMRTPPARDEHWVHQALLAHATDLTLIGTALLPVDGISQADTRTRIQTAVTSHSLWFHQPFRIDDWLLVDQHSPVMSAGRTFGRGDVWTRDGRLVASFAQESMVRPLAES